MNRRNFLKSGAAGAAAFGLPSVLAASAPGSSPVPRTVPPTRMKAAHQHDHSEPTLRLLAAMGVNHICGGYPALDKWSVEDLAGLRRQVESFGISLEALPLPMPSSEVGRLAFPDILLGREPGRERAIAEICRMIRNVGAAGIPMVKYNLTYVGVVRTARTPGRGGASCATFDYAEARKNEPPPTIAGEIGEKLYWERITHFLERVVPVAEEARVRLALHPLDPPVPPSGYRGVYPALGSVEGLKRFVQTVPSPYHGLNFCQGTISEMLERPDEQIDEVIRWFGTRGKIFMVHFRNINGGFLNFREALPDAGDVNMPRTLRIYREVGFEGMIMPDHVPSIEGDPDRYKAFAFCFGYIQALLQTMRAEA